MKKSIIKYKKNFKGGYKLIKYFFKNIFSKNNNFKNIKYFYLRCIIHFLLNFFGWFLLFFFVKLTHKIYRNWLYVNFLLLGRTQLNFELTA